MYKDIIKNYRLGWLSYIVSIILLFFITLFLKTYPYLAYAPLILSLIPILLSAIKDIAHKKISTDVFLILATIVGMLANQTQAITSVLLIMLVAKYVEELIEDKTKKAAQSLIKLMPTTIFIQTDEGEKNINIDDVKPGMQVLCKTGQQIAVDGTIIDGQANINESFLTGESVPKDKIVGNPVYAGTFVEDGAIVVMANHVGINTFFGKISKLLAEAEQHKATVIAVSNKAALIVVQLILIFAFFVWFFTRDLTLLATILVFGSPIELTLITPLAILAGTAAAFRHGILVKGSLALERFAHVDTIIFDKTGTLTMGEMNVVGVESFSTHHSENDILGLAAMIEKRSGHVLAKAILNEASKRNLHILDPERYESVTGHGVIATFLGKTYLLGSKHFTEAKEHGNIFIPEHLKSDSANPTDTFFYLSVDKTLLGRIRLRDCVRKDAQAVLQALARQGIQRTILLSGDLPTVATRIAKELGIHEAYGEVEPDKKLYFIKELQNKKHKVAMVGDGINDAPALSQADVGIAMGAMGMEPAIAAADIVLMSNDLSSLVFIHALSKKVMRLIKQNIFFGFALIHVIGISLALMGLVSPIQAALFHAVSDLLILLNSARLIKFVAR